MTALVDGGVDLHGPVETYRSASVDETEAIAAALVGRLPAGATLLLEGELGVGKTAFVRGAARACGVAEEQVASPTFALVHEYVRAGGDVAVYHFDLYRLERAGAAELEEIGVAEALADPGALKLVEWPRPALAPWTRGAVWVRLTRAAGEAREISVEWPA